MFPVLLSDAVSDDTLVYQRLHQAALALIAARSSGDPVRIAEAQAAFDALRGTNTQRVQAMRSAEEETARGNPLALLADTFGSAAKLAAVALAAVVLVPLLLRRKRS